MTTSAHHGSLFIAASRMLTPTGLVDNGWVEVSDGRIRAWGVGTPHAAADVMIDGILSPGFVDIHSHGGGGQNFDADPSNAETVLNTHRAHGTTTMVGSLVTASIDDLVEQVRTLSVLIPDSGLAGIHLEGPWLSPQYKGAHDVDLLVDPLIEDIARLLDAGQGNVRMVTIAPERPGALEAISYLSSHGVMAALGHTAATYEQARAGIEAGARGTTHLFNAMPELLHRAPGPVLALWHDPDVWVELVCDGIHVAADLVAHVMETKPDKVVLITDAMAATGSSDGDYMLGSLPVEVRDGIAHIAGTQTIAGSTLTLHRAIQVAVGAGVPLELALRAATSNPADYLGLSGVGRIEEGTDANLVILNNDLTLNRVMYKGDWF